MTPAGTDGSVDGWPGVSIAEASRELGIPMPTLRSWELRYNIPASANQRGAGKHRRYSPDELHGLRLMRDEIARGKRAGLAAESVRELLGLTGDARDFIGDILAASAASDPIAVRDHLSRAQAVLGIGPCLDDVLLPAMQQVGLWWQNGRCDIAQEQLTTEAARAWLDALIPYAPQAVRPSPVVLACGPTDLHTIGLEALGILLRYDGWNCRMLGARTPTASLIAAVRANRAGAVVLVSHLNSGRQRAIETLRAVTDLDVAVFYAGNAFSSPRSRRNVPGIYLGTRLQEAVATVDAQIT